MEGKTVQIVARDHAFYGLYCIVVSDYHDGFIACRPINGGAVFGIRASLVVVVVGASL